MQAGFDYLTLFKKQKQTPILETFPGGSVVKNPPCNAGDMGSIPGWGTKIPHAMEQISPQATSTETVSASTEDPACHSWVPSSK